MIIRKTTTAIIILVSLSFILSMGNLYSQPMEIEKPTSKRAKHLEDVKKNLGVHLQNIANLKSNINALKEELKILNTTIEKLIEDKAEKEALDLEHMHSYLRELNDNGSHILSNKQYALNDDILNICDKYFLERCQD